MFFGRYMQTFAYRRCCMSRFVTLKDVAERAGTTIGTVSYVINDRKGRYISHELRAKVLAAAEEPGNIILMHAVGANVSVQIASVVAGGLVISLVAQYL